MVRDLALQIGGGFYVSDWTRDHASFFRSIQLTKTMMFMILLLVVAVAAFNIVATLVMVVKEKRPAIAILRTFGALPRNVLADIHHPGGTDRPQWYAGWSIAGLVLLDASRGARARAWSTLTGEQFLDARVYFMSELPAFVEWHDVLQGVRGGLRIVRAGDTVSCVARGADTAGGGLAT